MSSNVKVLILSGDGLNCELETSMAFEEVGCKTEILHINKLIKTPKTLRDFSILVLPGGFSFGDEIKSGKILGLKINKFLKQEIDLFMNEKRPILGICNGFQVLTYLNLFNDSLTQSFALEQNTSKKFINKWVELEVNNTLCLWTQNLPLKFELPIRHGEGRVIPSELLNEDSITPLVALTYTEDVNGSYKKIAGLTSSNGNVLGLMPHPEAALFELHDPSSKDRKRSLRASSMMFRNAKDYCLKKGFVYE